MNIQIKEAPAVSVIVPVYNVENFLAECLDSVEAQTFQDFEVIAINDGSTDRSPIILEAYAKKDPRIKVINQANAGLSAARNAGLNVAVGEYVLFLDSDDLLTADALEKVVEAARENDSDIVVFDYFVLDNETGGLGYHRNQRLYAELNRRTFTLQEVPEMTQFIGAWDRAYRRDFLAEHNFRFKVGKLYEDVPFCFETEFQAKRITLINEHIYYWRRNVSNSITNIEKGSRQHERDFLYVQKCAQDELERADATLEMWSYYAGYFFEYAYKHLRWVKGKRAFFDYFEQLHAIASPKLLQATNRTNDPRILYLKKCLIANSPTPAYIFMKSTNQLQRPHTVLSRKVELSRCKREGLIDKQGNRLTFSERPQKFMPEFKGSYPFVSVLIPCYNVEKYIRECLDSVLAQDLQNFEAICINDGSTDSTLDIIKLYCAKDMRFRLIDKPNSGYGASMNMGLEAAKGEYIAILESDDTMEPNTLSALVSEAKVNNADAVKANFYFHWTTPKPRREKNNLILPEHPHVVDPKHFHELFWFMPSIWSAIYSREFLNENNIRFLETSGASYQDLSFTFKVWSFANRVVLLQDAFVNYRQDNENSSINSPGKVFCVCDEFAEIERFLEENPQMQPLKNIETRLKFDSYIWNFKRLSPELREEFLPCFYEEFLLEETLGNIDYSMFWPWNEVDCRLLLKDPIKFLNQANKVNCKPGRVLQTKRYLKAGGPKLLKKRFQYKGVKE